MTTKTTKQAVCKVAFTLVIAFAAQSVANTTPPAPPKTGSPSKPAAASAPYELKLLFISDIGSQQSDIPNLQVHIVSVTQYKLIYVWIPYRTITFQVEYKAASEDMGKEGGWTRLMPSQPEGLAQSDEHVVREQMQPGQEDDIWLPGTSPPLLKEGYYRITATLARPGVGEFRGTISPTTLVRRFDLAVPSNSLILRRTETGFAEVPAAASPAPAH